MFEVSDTFTGHREGALISDTVAILVICGAITLVFIQAPTVTVHDILWALKYYWHTYFGRFEALRVLQQK